MMPEVTNSIYVQPLVQQVFAITSEYTDFKSEPVQQEMEKVHQDVKTVLESAIIDSTKLSLNFTV